MLGSNQLLCCTVGFTSSFDLKLALVDLMEVVESVKKLEHINKRKKEELGSDKDKKSRDQTTRRKDTKP